MNAVSALIKRNTKLFFKDKGMFFTSLITPLILLVLYATFLANVYRDSFSSAIPEFLKIDEKLLDGAVAAQLVSSLLAVSCVTVAFCSNLLMVQDKISGARRDFCVSPVKRSALAVSYFFSSAFSTLIITFTALGVCLLYILKKGWYLSGSDVALLVLGIVLCAYAVYSLVTQISMFKRANTRDKVFILLNPIVTFIVGVLFIVAKWYMIDAVFIVLGVVAILEGIALMFKTDSSEKSDEKAA